jgi:hypothetical protein
MAQLGKFNEKAIAIYGCAQIAENVSVINTTPTGTITTSLSTTAVTGVGTKFLTEVAVGSYITNGSDVAAGRVLTVTSDTAIVLEANSLVLISAAAFRTGLGPKNALAVLNLNFTVELTSEAFEYTGDELNRDETTVITDRFAKFDFETFLPVKGTTSSPPLVSEIPMADWFQSSGMAVVIPVTAISKYTITNSQASNKYMTIEIRKASPDLSLTQKTYTITNARGTFDFNINLGSKPKLKFNYQGNVGSTLSIEKPSITPDFQNQKTTISESVKSTTVNLALLELWSGSTEPANITFTPPALPTGSTNIVFDKVVSPNTTGFEYSRYMTSSVDGWSKGALPSDLTLTILEDTSAASYNPDTKLEALHRFTLCYADIADTAGKVVTVTFHKLELTKVTASKIAKYNAQDLGFRSIGYTDIVFS